MNIKPLPRVLYRNNPLVEVIAQVRFPTQFAMRTVAPAEFQAALGEDYPVVFVEQMRGLNLSFEEGAQVQHSTETYNIFHFDSQDGTWRVSLCHEFVALTCSRYSEWRNFQARLDTVLQRFTGCYTKIGVFNRVGLRYRDVLIREDLGLDGVPWSELLAPWVLGVYGSEGMMEKRDLTDNFESSVDQMVTQGVINMGPSKVTITSGLAQKDNKRGFLIDADFYSEGLNGWSLEDIGQRFTSLHSNAGHLFNHCITERLQQALGPTAS